ncbi:MAG: type II toxin-antitoxin system Phd/YefM family antitoxin [Opitutales bacterium]|nr:type II toxin-antitoxin system Phd/YefM family antitoxin [Opitutales bacterium]
MKKERFSVRFAIMTTISATKARDSLYRLIDEANESHTPIQITGKRGNAVLLSEDDWKAIEETLYLSSIPGMAESIKEARNEKIENCSEELDW